jgi:hypothetical protein
VAQFEPLKKTARESICCFGDRDRIWLSQPLQPRCDVGGSSNDLAFLGDATADQISNHHLAGGNADTCLQCQSRPRAEGANGCDDGQPGEDRTFSVVLRGLRISKIGQQSIAHVSCDIAVGALYNVRAASEEAGDDFIFASAGWAELSGRDEHVEAWRLIDFARH